MFPWDYQLRPWCQLTCCQQMFGKHIWLCRTYIEQFFPSWSWDYNVFNTQLGKFKELLTSDVKNLYYFNLNMHSVNRSYFLLSFFYCLFEFQSCFQNVFLQIEGGAIWNTLLWSLLNISGTFISKFANTRGCFATIWKHHESFQRTNCDDDIMVRYHPPTTSCDFLPKGMILLHTRRIL
jgi:hypothetical protein